MEKKWEKMEILGHISVKWSEIDWLLLVSITMVRRIRD
jgi:hypothetical protein